MSEFAPTLSAWLNQQVASLPLPVMLVLFGLALLFSAVGFYRVVYFISIGYAFSIVAMAVAVVLLLSQNLTVPALLQNALLVFWGLRLGIFLVRREMKPSYGKELAETHQRTAGMALSRKALIWAGVSALYVVMFTPSLFVLSPAPGVATPDGAGALVQWAAVALMAGALLLESVADQQKSAFKARNPGQFCNTGLYRWVRCPNYLGEILFWVGNWAAALLFYATALRWALALVGIVCIILIMLGSAKRLEGEQDKRYAKNPAYGDYVRRTPILIPFLPVYTLHNLRVYLG